MTRTDLESSEFNSYYEQYINLVPKNMGLVDALTKGGKRTYKFFKQLPSDKHDYRYEEGKWTPKEVLLHLIDTERVFSYRALRFGRMDKTPLEGFEQDDFVAHSNATDRSMQSLLEEYKSVRMSTIALYESMGDDGLLNVGQASGSPLSPRSAGFITAGHDRHHVEIIKERYL